MLAFPAPTNVCPIPSLVSKSIHPNDEEKSKPINREEKDESSTQRTSSHATVNALTLIVQSKDRIKR
eukprot:m.55741 g.55741  ORF g.55741 m.55741 type:complete len:67 (+) comp7767_c0_seq2:1858-2058(+)